MKSRGFNVSTLLEHASLLAVALLFPGFFFYNSAVAYSIIPPFVGGGFGPVALVVSFPLLLLQVVESFLYRSRISLIDVTFFVMFLFMSIWAFLHLIFGSDYQGGFDLFLSSFSVIFFWLVLYVAFRNIDLSGRFVIPIFSLSLLVMLVVSIANSSGYMFYAALTSDSGVPVASYQGFARSSLVSAVILLSVFRGVRLALWVVASVILLFLLGARSEFVGFLFALLSILYFQYGLGRLTVWVPLLVLSLFGVGFAGGMFDSESRILQLLNIQEASSYLARRDVHDYALNTIFSNPFWGDYGSSRALGGSGYYSHDALSAWVTYGAIGFFLFIGMNLLAFGSSVRVAFRSRQLAADPAVAFAVGMTAYSILMMVASKSVFDPIFAVGWGAASSKRCRPASSYAYGASGS